VINQATLMGHVGQDPAVRTLASGDPVAEFSLATSERWKDKQSGETKDRTEWHRVVVYNPVLAEVVREYVQKGSRVFVQGQIRHRKYERDGADVQVTEIVLDRVGAVLKLLGEPGGRAEPRRGERDTRNERDDRRERGVERGGGNGRPPKPQTREPGDDEDERPSRNANGNGRSRGRVPQPEYDDEIPF
jgi:single-strand DNA-binding protein